MKELASCHGKEGFRTFTEADKVARHQRRRRNSRSEPYKCPFCGLFHIGQRNKGMGHA